MARKNATKVIDGVTFTLQSMSVRKQMRMYPKFAALFAPVLEAGEKALGGDKGAMAEMVASFGERLTPDDIETLCVDMFWSLRRNNVDIGTENARDNSLRGTIFDEAMAADTMTVWELLAWAVEVNFGDFFGKVRVWLAKAKALAEAQEAAKKTAESPSS